MGWGIAGGVLGIILMFGAYKWATSWAAARAGGTYVPTIGSRPRRLAGVPEEAPPDAIMPPAMEVLRYGAEPVVVPDTEADTSEMETEAPAILDADAPAEAPLAAAAQTETAVVDEMPAENADVEEISITAIEGDPSGIVITEIHHGSDDQNESVLIENTGPNPVALENWRLTDSGERNEYVFTAVVLEPGASLRVHMWAGQDSDTDIFVGRRRNWWNNDGDAAHLYDASGVLVYSRKVAIIDEG